MRKIKYKGMHIHVIPANKHLDGTWIYGFLCNEKYINSPDLEGEFIVDENTVGEFSGITDKNGTDIYEWDVIKIIIFNVFTGKISSESNEVVEFKNGSFGVVHGKHRTFACFNDFDMNVVSFEVIGNIHEKDSTNLFEK